MYEVSHSGLWRERSECAVNGAAAVFPEHKTLKDGSHGVIAMPFNQPCAGAA